MSNPEIFAHIEKFLLFLGNGNSGSSLQGNLLNAHPDIVISQEAMVVRRLKENRKMDRKQMLNYIWARSKEHAKKGDKWYKYDYHVPGWWQGRVKRMRIIGDKRASETTYYLSVYDGLLDYVRELADAPLRFIHCVRNPFDNIATIMAKNRQYHNVDMTLEDAVVKYFDIEGMAQELKGRLRKSEPVFMTKLEELVEDPRKWLRDVCAFLDIGMPDGYAEACVNIVFDRPRKTRQTVSWPKELIDRVNREKDKFPYLAEYQFDK